MHDEEMTAAPDLDTGLEAVRARIREALAETSLGPKIPAIGDLVGSGKMLRSRIALWMAPVCGVDTADAERASASIEMIHAASLLHDDVIDGASLRRGQAAFWVEAGTSGAILLGDLLYCRGILLASEAKIEGLAHLLVSKAAEMCDAESQQELLLRGAEPTWERCIAIARRKTGSLFAYIAGAVAGEDAARRAACEEAGYLIGTAYQLADDLLDASGDEGLSGKTLGTDEARGKITAVSARLTERGTPSAIINDLLDESCAVLAAWPAVAERWRSMLEAELRPSLIKYATSAPATDA